MRPGTQKIIKVLGRQKSANLLSDEILADLVADVRELGFDQFRDMAKELSKPKKRGGPASVSAEFPQDVDDVFTRTSEKSGLKRGEFVEALLKHEAIAGFAKDIPKSARTKPKLLPRLCMEIGPEVTKQALWDTVESVGLHR